MDTIEVTFPGGKRVDASVGGLVVHTDQPISAGGEGTAVSPFDLFLASIATCAGIYVLGFCEARSIATLGITLRQRLTLDATTKLPSAIRLELTLPDTFPHEYRQGVLRAAECCKVKKTIAAMPLIEVSLATDGSGQ